MDYIDQIEIATGEKAIKEFLPLQQGDVKQPYSANTNLEKWIGFKPNTSIKYGVNKFVNWYRNYYLM